MDKARLLAEKKYGLKAGFRFVPGAPQIGETLPHSNVHVGDTFVTSEKQDGASVFHNWSDAEAYAGYCMLHPDFPPISVSIVLVVGKLVRPKGHKMRRERVLASPRVVAVVKGVEELSDWFSALSALCSHVQADPQGYWTRS